MAAGRRRLRVQCIGKRAFPRFLAAAAFERFAFVDSRPDILVLEHLGPPSSDRTKIDLCSSFEALERGLPTVIFHTLDRWDWSEQWDDRARELCGRVTLLFGTGLPPGPIGNARVVPLLCPASRQQVPPRRGAEIDIFFSGWFQPPGHQSRRPPGLPESLWDDPHEQWQVPAARHKAGWLRVLRERGEAVAILAEALWDCRLVFENRTFWFATVEEQHRMSAEYDAAMSRARVAFTPPGRGYSTQRLTDGWAHRCLVLTPRLTDRVQLPEPRSWWAETHHVCYRWDLLDLAAKARFALEHENELGDRVEAGHAYFKRWGTVAAQVAQITRAMEQSVEG
jgi:hypothetical protein